MKWRLYAYLILSLPVTIDYVLSGRTNALIISAFLMIMAKLEWMDFNKNQYN